jgi:hypothetical protein
MEMSTNSSQIRIPISKESIEFLKKIKPDSFKKEQTPVLDSNINMDQNNPDSTAESEVGELPIENTPGAEAESDSENDNDSEPPSNQENVETEVINPEDKIISLTPIQLKHTLMLLMVKLPGGHTRLYQQLVQRGDKEWDEHFVFLKNKAKTIPSTYGIYPHKYQAHPGSVAFIILHQIGHLVKNELQPERWQSFMDLMQQMKGIESLEVPTPAESAEYEEQFADFYAHFILNYHYMSTQQTPIRDWLRPNIFYGYMVPKSWRR